MVLKVFFICFFLQVQHCQYNFERSEAHSIEVGWEDCDVCVAESCHNLVTILRVTSTSSVKIIAISGNMVATITSGNMVAISTKENVFAIATSSNVDAGHILDSVLAFAGPHLLIIKYIKFIKGRWVGGYCNAFSVNTENDLVRGSTMISCHVKSDHSKVIGFLISVA